MISHEVVMALARKDPPWLHDRRMQAWHAFQSSSQEKFRYGRTVQYEVSLDFSLLPSQEQLVATKPKGVELLSFKEAFRKYPFVCEKYMLSSCGMDKVRAFHIATLKEGLFIHVPAECKVDTLLRITSNMMNALRCDYVFIWLEENARLDVLFDVQGSGRLRSEIIEVRLEKSASLSFQSVQNLGECVEFRERRALLDDHAKIHWLSATIGGSIVNCATSTVLAGPCASQKCESVIVAKGIVDEYATAVHRGVSTSSDSITRGVAGTDGMIISRGLAHVTKDAAKADAYQRLDLLILGSGKGHALPNLEINNHDVSCTHGSSVGQIDQDALFYVQSRGIKDAKKLLVHGFLSGTISENSHKELIDAITLGVEKLMVE